MKAKCGGANAGISIISIGGAEAFGSRSEFVLGYVMVGIGQRERRDCGGNLLFEQSALSVVKIQILA